MMHQNIPLRFLVSVRSLNHQSSFYHQQKKKLTHAWKAKLSRARLADNAEKLRIFAFSYVFLAEKKIFQGHLKNKQQLDGCKILSDGVPIGSGTFAGELRGITIWNHKSNERDANLKDSADTV